MRHDILIEDAGPEQYHLTIGTLPQEIKPTTPEKKGLLQRMLGTKSIQEINGSRAMSETSSLKIPANRETLADQIFAAYESLINTMSALM